MAKFVQAEQFPEARPRGARRRKLTPYLPYLLQRWKAGEHNAAKLHRDIRAQGCAWLGNDDPCVSRLHCETRQNLAPGPAAI